MFGFRGLRAAPEGEGVVGVKLSLVIATRNRAARLNQMIDALAVVEGIGDTDVIVVDSASTDDTAAVLERLRRDAPFRFTLLREVKPGVTRAQNAAIRQATGDVIVFTDDDCFPERSFLAEMRRVFERNDVGYAGGRILLYNPDDYPLTINASTETVIYPPYSFIGTGHISGANMAFRREVLREIGGFDERLGAGGPLRAAGDIDVQGRASAHGWRGGYFPGPTVYHDHGRKAADARALELRYAYGLGAYYAKLAANRETRRYCLQPIYWKLRDKTAAERRNALRGAIHYVWLCGTDRIRTLWQRN